MRARERMRDACALGPDLDTPAGRFAAGDHVVVKRNDLRLGIHNGDRGLVTAVEASSGAIEVEVRGDCVRLETSWLAEPTTGGDPALVHGYAITGHVAQGLTVDRAFVLANAA
jgi:ATP-dependent exoDNAse (exonuclease V) alpha subunit